MFKRVLIANRGEIAIRIARAASSLGVDSVAVFTPADSLSLHTRLAGKARQIGVGGDPVRGYLDIDAVIAAARESGSDCVHPGYGFLSENANFAQRCQAEGLRFIGPSPATLALVRRQGARPAPLPRRRASPSFPARRRPWRRAPRRRRWPSPSATR